MNFKNLVLFYFLLIFFISPIYILGGQISNYKETEPGGKFGNNKKRKLADSNYIIVKYYEKTEYTSYNSTYRNGISHIINENTKYSVNDSFTIQANNTIEIHFSSPVSSLYNFFSVDYDPNIVNIISIDFSNFDSTFVTNIAYMLSGLNQLKSLNLSNFNTSLVTDMENMFYNCTQLESLDLSKFSTSLVTNMAGMFYNCNQLESLNLSNFVTLSVTNMNRMFYGCTKLELLDISNFDSSKITNLQMMFEGLSSIKYLNLVHL